MVPKNGEELKLVGHYTGLMGVFTGKSTETPHSPQFLSEFPYEETDRIHLPDPCRVSHGLNTGPLCRFARGTDTTISAQKKIPRT